MKTGIIVIGHGSREAVGEANKVTFEITEMLRKRSEADIIEAAIMNSKSNLPGLVEVAEKVAKTGVERILIVPFFITNGMHIRYDIPEIIEEVQAKFPAIEFKMVRHMGSDSRLVDILMDRIQEVG